MSSNTSSTSTSSIEKTVGSSIDKMMLALTQSYPVSNILASLAEQLDLTADFHSLSSSKEREHHLRKLAVVVFSAMKDAANIEDLEHV